MSHNILHVTFQAEESVAKECVCGSCKSRFCFKCGNSYHAPTDCETIRRWLNKCADDSETANYISANTKVSSTMIELWMTFLIF